MKRFGQLLASALFTTLAATGIIQTQSVRADSALPAVSETNFNVRFGGGLLTGVPGGDFIAKTRGSAALPLTDRSGFQFDWVLASVGNGTGTWGAVGGHWFQRDPSTGLMGLYADWNSFIGFNFWTVAFEGEAYFDRSTFAATLGLQSNGTSTLWADLRAIYYPDDNFMVFAGYRHSLNGNSALVGVERQLRSGEQAYALYFDGVINDRGLHQAVGGVKFYFGPDKDLIRRHREDDPINRLHPAGEDDVGEEPPEPE